MTNKNAELTVLTAAREKSTNSRTSQQTMEGLQIQCGAVRCTVFRRPAKMAVEPWAIPLGSLARHSSIECCCLGSHGHADDVSSGESGTRPCSIIVTRHFIADRPLCKYRSLTSPAPH